MMPHNWPQVWASFGLITYICLTLSGPISVATTVAQQVGAAAVGSPWKAGLNHGQSPSSKVQAQKCTKQSVTLARQMLTHEFEMLNGYNSIWFNDFDKDELVEGQKQSLSNIVMSGASARLLNSDGQPLMEIEASYFRPISLSSHQAHFSVNESTRRSGGGSSSSSTSAKAHLFHPSQPITLRLLRRHPDRCYYNPDKEQFSYVLGIAVGPLEHNLDVIYNLPKELRLSQPIESRYAQISMLVPRLLYEITLKQRAHYQLNSPGCSLEVSDVTFLNSPTVKSSLSILTTGLASNNQTALQIDRLFDDYTRPAISQRLRQILKFYMNTKTLPLRAVVHQAG